MSKKHKARPGGAPQNKTQKQNHKQLDLKLKTTLYIYLCVCVKWNWTTITSRLLIRLDWNMEPGHSIQAGSNQPKAQHSLNLLFMPDF